MSRIGRFVRARLISIVGITSVLAVLAGSVIVILVVTPTQPTLNTSECSPLLTPLLTGEPRSDLTIMIHAPQSCDEVGPLLIAGQLDVTGQYKGSVTGVTLWVLVRPRGDGLLYPQAIDPCDGPDTGNTHEDGRWRANVRIGRSEDLDQYDILAGFVDTDSELQRFMEAWLSDACNDASTDGIAVDELGLLSGLIGDIDSVTVRAILR